MPENTILLSDTNIILKLVLFEKFDLCGFAVPGYGKIKFHPIVEAEIKRWIDNHHAGLKVRKVDKFSIELLKVAIKRARQNLEHVTTPTKEDKELIFDSYESVHISLSSKSALPTENDLMLLLHADKGGCYMLTGDDIVYKLGKKIIGDKSIELEDIFISLLANNLVTRDEVKDYSELLDSYQELFKISKVLR